MQIREYEFEYTVLKTEHHANIEIDLDEYGQVGRILSEEITLDSLYEHPIDYTAVNEEMAKRREESLRYLSLSLTLPHREGTLSSSSLSSSLEKNEY